MKKIVSKAVFSKLSSAGKKAIISVAKKMGSTRRKTKRVTRKPRY